MSFQKSLRGSAPPVASLSRAAVGAKKGNKSRPSIAVGAVITSAVVAGSTANEGDEGGGKKKSVRWDDEPDATASIDQALERKGAAQEKENGALNDNSAAAVAVRGGVMPKHLRVVSGSRPAGSSREGGEEAGGNEGEALASRKRKAQGIRSGAQRVATPSKVKKPRAGGDDYGEGNAGMASSFGSSNNTVASGPAISSSSSAMLASFRPSATYPKATGGETASLSSTDEFIAIPPHHHAHSLSLNLDSRNSEYVQGQQQMDSGDSESTDGIDEGLAVPNPHPPLPPTGLSRGLPLTPRGKLFGTPVSKGTATTMNSPMRVPIHRSEFFAAAIKERDDEQELAAVPYSSSTHPSSGKVLKFQEGEKRQEGGEGSGAIVLKKAPVGLLARKKEEQRKEKEEDGVNPVLLQQLKGTLRTVMSQRQTLSVMVKSLEAGLGGMAAAALTAEEAGVVQGSSSDNSRVGAGACTCGGSSGGSCDDDVKGALRQRLEEMQAKVSTLEQEKMKLSMALAPLEGRLQKREEAFAAERAALKESMADLQTRLTAAEEQVASLHKQHEVLKEERTELSGQLRELRRKAEDNETKTANDFWQRSIAATRLTQRLEADLAKVQAELEEASKSKEEAEAAALTSKEAAESLRRRLTEAEEAASRSAIAETKLSEAELKLEVVQREFVATSAQLSATQTESAEYRGRMALNMETASAKWRKEKEAVEGEVERLRRALCEQQDQNSRGGAGGSGAVGGRDNEGSVSGNSGICNGSGGELRGLLNELEASKKRAAGLEERLEKAEKQRRVMHNRIQELRGNVRVFVRTRPFLPNDKEDSATGLNHGQPPQSIVKCGGDAGTVTVTLPIAPHDKAAAAAGPVQHSFVFDQAFPPTTSQDEVFAEVSGFVQSALDGYKVCLFSYGQTGSGKTFTMQGTGSSSGVMRGIIPRAVEQILTRIGELQEHGEWSYSTEASFLEIYNEQLRDLLVEGGAAAGGDKLAIKKNGVEARGMEVAGLTKVDIDTTDRDRGMRQLSEVMTTAARSRSVARTNMNAESSRSHSVFTLWLKGVNANTNTTLYGVLHLCDLAGSERLDRSGAGDDAVRLKETQSINKSLSSVADVFIALANKQSHIPFRNSKLTYLLQDCLSGDGKALMFVNLSPTVASSQETLCSLRFAGQVAQVELGKPKRQVSCGAKK